MTYKSRVRSTVSPVPAQHFVEAVNVLVVVVSEGQISSRHCISTFFLNITISFFSSILYFDYQLNDFFVLITSTTAMFNFF